LRIALAWSLVFGGLDTEMAGAMDLRRICVSAPRLEQSFSSRTIHHLSIYVLHIFDSAGSPLQGPIYKLREMTGNKENKKGTSAEASPKRKTPESLVKAIAKKIKTEKSLAKQLGDITPAQAKRIEEAFPVPLPPRDFLGRRGGISGPAGRPGDAEATKDSGDYCQKETIDNGCN
jgi:hypothetical protein